MREILFRAKRKDNGEWVEGHYGEYYNGNKNVPCISIPSKEAVSGSLCYEVIPETIFEFTGLNDKNGTKIFEGDILRLCGDGYDWNGIVVFGRTTSDEDNLEDYGYGWQLDKITKDEPVYTKILLWVEAEADGIDCEIIGNIHDNPELLEE